MSNLYMCIYGMMRSDICKDIYGSRDEPTSLWYSEIPILARFAAAGEIVSIPVALRRYRRHAASISWTTVAEVKRMSLLRCRWFSVSAACRARVEQLAVLSRAEIRRREKVTIIISILGSYFTYVVQRFVRLPSRLRRITAGVK
jgi:hypothetical protein